MVDVYCSSDDQASVQSILDTVLSISGSLMVTKGSVRFAGVPMTANQFSAFETAIDAVASAKWYQCENKDIFDRKLLNTNVAEDYANADVYWHWRNEEQANAGTTIAARRDVIYAAPDGVSSNAGTLAAPLDIRSAFLQSPIAAPSVILREGTHDIDADTTITAAVAISNYPAEDVFIRLVSPSAPTVRQLAINNSGTYFEANASGGMLRIGSEPSSRQQSDQATYPNIGRLDCLGNANANGLFRGVYLHDLLTVAYQSGTGGILFKDCVLWNFGYQFPLGVNGEYMYLQNSGASEKLIDNVILGPVMGLMSQIYGEGAGITTIRLNRVIGLADKALWASSSVPIQDLTLENSLLLHGNVLFGAGSQDNVNVAIRDNYLVARTSSFSIGKWSGGDIADNTIVALGNNLLSCSTSSPDVNYNNNVYYNPNSREVSNGTGKTFATWQGEGRDVDSTHIIANPSNYVQVNVCSSGKMKAFVGVSNMQSLDTVAVDVSGLSLVQGASYRLRNAYDPLADTEDFVYDGSGSIEVNFVGRSIAVPIGDEAAIESLSAEKGAWILEAL
jgi:hypothetical protein